MLGGYAGPRLRKKMKWALWHRELCTHNARMNMRPNRDNTSSTCWGPSMPRFVPASRRRSIWPRSAAEFRELVLDSSPTPSDSIKTPLSSTCDCVWLMCESWGKEYLCQIKTFARTRRVMLTEINVIIRSRKKPLLGNKRGLVDCFGGVSKGIVQFTFDTAGRSGFPLLVSPFI